MTVALRVLAAYVCITSILRVSNLAMMVADGPDPNWAMQIGVIGEPVLFGLTSIALFFVAPFLAKISIVDQLAQVRFKPESQRQAEAFGIAAFGLWIAGDVLTKFQSPDLWRFEEYARSAISLGLVFGCRFLQAWLSFGRRDEIRRNRRPASPYPS